MVRSETSLSGSGTFKDPAEKTIDFQWSSVDKMARAGLKLSSVLLLIAESLIRAHQRIPEDLTFFSIAEVGWLIFLLGPLTRQVFDQFGRVALKSVGIRRNNVLSVFNWPYADARARLEQLPVLGSVLFSGKFFETFKREVERHRVVSQTSFAPQARSLTTMTPAVFRAPKRKAKASQRIMIPSSAESGKRKAKSASAGLPLESSGNRFFLA